MIKPTYPDFLQRYVTFAKEDIYTQNPPISSTALYPKIRCYSFFGKLILETFAAARRWAGIADAKANIWEYRPSLEGKSAIYLKASDAKAFWAAQHDASDNVCPETAEAWQNWLNKWTITKKTDSVFRTVHPEASSSLMNADPIMLALEESNITALSELLEKGSNPNIINTRDGMTPLTQVLFLIRNGALNKKQNYIRMFEMLIEKADVNLPALHGLTPLCVAVFLGLTEYIPLLIQKGADPELQAAGIPPLAHALTYKQDSAFLELLKAKANVNSTDFQGYTALHAAAAQNLPSMIKLLVKKDAKLDAVNKQGITRFMIALLKGNESAALALLEEGANVNLKDDQGRTALHYAAAQNLPSIIKLLVKKGAKLDAVDEQGLTPFLEAICKGNESTALTLLQVGANVNQTDLNGYTALHYAAVQNLPSMIKLLVKKGVKLDAVTILGVAPLGVAVLKGNESAVLTLLKAGANVNQTDLNGNTALHYAAVQNLPSMIKLLVKKGLELDAVNKQGSTPLGVAVLQGNESAVLTLLNAGANVNSTDIHGCTALHYADVGKLPSMIKLLIKKGVKLDAVSKQGVTPFAAALFRGNEPTALALLEAGANINLEDVNGCTALHYAAMGNLPSIIELLLKKGAKLDAANEKGITPLGAALYTGSESAALALLEAGASVNLRDYQGHTALHYAAIGNLPSMIELLVNKGVKQDVLNEDGYTPLVNAIGQGSESAANKLIHLGADNQYATSVMKAKFASHIWGVKGKAIVRTGTIYNKEQRLEGFPSRMIPSLFHSYLTDFFNKIGDTEPILNPAAKQYILKAFSNAYPDNSYKGLEKIIKAAKCDEPCLILGGFEKHLISMTVTSTLLSVSNRGEGRDNQQETTDVFMLPKHMQTPELFEKLTKKYANAEEFYQMLYALGLKRVQGGIPQKLQKIGNCVTANTKAALMFLFTLIAGGDIKEGKRLYKQFTYYLRERTLADYKSMEFPDPLLIETLHEKQARKAKSKEKAVYHMHLLPQKRPGLAWKKITKIDALLEKAVTTELKRAEISEIFKALKTNLASDKEELIHDLKQDSNRHVWRNIYRNIQLTFRKKEDILPDDLSQVVLTRDAAAILEQMWQISLKCRT